MTSVLILGAGGQTGREVARQITQHRQGVEILGTSRDPATIQNPNIVVLAFDWEDRDTWPAVAATNPDAVYLVRPDQLHDAPERISAFLEQLGEVSRVVLLSGHDNHEVPEDSWGARVERAVQDGPSPWTVVRPGPFMDLLVDESYLLPAIRERSAIELPMGPAGMGLIDVRDIAEVIVAALLGDGHTGQLYHLTGQEAPTLNEVAARMSTALGRTIEYVDPGSEATIASWGSRIAPWRAERLAEVMEWAREGSHATVTNDVEKVTGHPPRSLDAFIEENLDRWRP
ncbi:NAD(P)H-binding protein [Nocardia pseudovaccinii]|uniref:NmrA family NAD(P)-binding protein n=1 Tax=Nocardia pseudovaccinii TaxID=189540 RepID=UPI003D8FB465